MFQCFPDFTREVKGLKLSVAAAFPVEKEPRGTDLGQTSSLTQSNRYTIYLPSGREDTKKVKGLKCAYNTRMATYRNWRIRLDRQRL